MSLNLRNISQISSKLLTMNAATSADNGNAFSKLNGRPNQSITKPISLDNTTGEVVVRTSTGKSKIRKGQSDEDYNMQLNEYFRVQHGPRRTEIGWMDDLSVDEMLDENPDLNIKLHRQKLTGFCHLLYYRKQYNECAKLCVKIIPRYEAVNKKKKIAKEIEELEYMLKRSEELSQ